MAGTKSQMPELKKFMDKQLIIKMNGGRTICGTLRGYDVFMNLSLEQAYETRKMPRDPSTNEERESQNIQMGMAVVRGNSILMIDCQER
jgi:small nuclear ribonucleoprotein G